MGLVKRHVGMAICTWLRSAMMVILILEMGVETVRLKRDGHVPELIIRHQTFAPKLKQLL